MSKSKVMTTPAADRRPIVAGDLADMKRPPTHPGDIFRLDFREPDGTVLISQAEAARRMGMPVNRLNEFERGKRGVTPNSALLLAALTGTTAEFWMNLQARWELWHALKKIGGKPPKVQPIATP